MASVHPAMKGRFGSTEYFMVTMKANDVANQLTIPKEMPDWGELDLEERFQREINYNRVKKQIAPYLAQDPDRFFGALIVDVINAEEMEFEAADNVLSKVPKLYQTAARSFGFLTLSGGEMLVPLDGQHRLAAIQFALTGKDEKQRQIEGIDPNPDLANDDVLLILIRHDETQRGRKIFNKVNRYAKKTTKAEDLITADDDAIAVITRETVANDIVGSRLVNYRSNTLSDSTHHFTTLATLYEGTKAVVEETFGKVDTQTLPDAAKVALYRDTAREYWDQLTNGVTVFHSVLLRKEDDGDEQRREVRRTSLLGKPVAQLALMYAVVRLKTQGKKSDGSQFSWSDILEAINGLNWANDNPTWQNVLMIGSRVVSGRQAVGFASRVIAYLLGEEMSDTEVEHLTEQYASHFPEAERPQIVLPERGS